MPSQDQCNRLEDANDLLRLIGSHGRRFFWVNDNTKEGFFAHFVFINERLVYVDEITRRSIYLGRTLFGNQWPHFSHNGKLRALIEGMRDYILRGSPVALWRIAELRDASKPFGSNFWGYSPEAARIVRESAAMLPIIAHASELGRASAPSVSQPSVRL